MEANEQWNVEDLKSYVGHILEMFGCDRIMWGSDWPVCCLRTEHSGWFAAAECLTEGVSATERAHLFGGGAAGFHRLNP